MKIFKYELPCPDDAGQCSLKLPVKSEILSVGMQNDQIVVWVKIPLSPIPVVDSFFLVVNTGINFYTDGDERFIGTVTSSNGIVWHVFERNNL